MYDKAVELLTVIGLPDAAGDPILSIIFETVTESICNKTNQETVPEGLERAGTYRIAGQYLKLKKNSGQLTELNGMDFEGAIKQIQEGDTSISFGVGDGDMTPEQRLEYIISWLLSYGEEQMYRYRKLVW